MSTSTSIITLRVPSTHQPPNSPSYADFTPPSGTWLAGTWHVTHSSLPLWKGKRNVNITYVNLAGNKVQDTTAYQEKPGGKVKALAGINTPTPGVPAAFDWRGKGWLMVASSHWEILGFGDVVVGGTGEEGAAGSEAAAAAAGHQWVVTYFSKTLFTPAGVDIYSRKKGGLPQEVVEVIKEKLAALEDPEIKGLVGGIFDVTQADD